MTVLLESFCVPAVALLIGLVLVGAFCHFLVGGGSKPINYRPPVKQATAIEKRPAALAELRQQEVERAAFPKRYAALRDRIQRNRRLDYGAEVVDGEVVDDVPQLGSVRPRLGPGQKRLTG